MKKLIILCLLVGLGLTVSAQKYYYVAPDGQVAGDTSTYASAAGFYSAASDGVVSFTFTHADVADSLSFARIEGSDDGATWVALTGNAALANTSTDGTSKIYTSTPLLYYKYRARIACATGDTVTITNPILMYKED